MSIWYTLGHSKMSPTRWSCHFLHVFQKIAILVRVNHYISLLKKLLHHITKVRNCVLAKQLFQSIAYVPCRWNAWNFKQQQPLSVFMLQISYLVFIRIYQYLHHILECELYYTFVLTPIISLNVINQNKYWILDTQIFYSYQFLIRFKQLKAF